MTEGSRSGSDRDVSVSQSSYQVAAVILAAGLSSRMAPTNKLLVRDQAGSTVIARVVRACLDSQAACLYVVTGHQADYVRDAVCAVVSQKPLSCVHAGDYRQGLSASLRAGINALPQWADGMLVCLGDMPLVEPEVLNTLIEAFAPSLNRDIIVPYWKGQRGNPVLWGRKYFSEIGALSGDLGARALIDQHVGHVTSVDAGGPGVVLDFDTPDSLLEHDRIRLILNRDKHAR